MVNISELFRSKSKEFDLQRYTFNQSENNYCKHFIANLETATFYSLWFLKYLMHLNRFSANQKKPIKSQFLSQSFDQSAAKNLKRNDETNLESKISSENIEPLKIPILQNKSSEQSIYKPEYNESRF